MFAMTLKVLHERDVWFEPLLSAYSIKDFPHVADHIIIPINKYLDVLIHMLDMRSYKIKWGYPTSWLEIGVW